MKFFNTTFCSRTNLKLVRYILVACHRFAFSQVPKIYINNYMSVVIHSTCCVWKRREEGNEETRKENKREK